MARIGYELHDLGVEQLRTELLKRSADHHRKLLVKQMKNKKRMIKDKELDDEVRGIERFFLSYFGQLLSGGKGEYIIEKDMEIAQEDFNRGKKSHG